VSEYLPDIWRLQAQGDIRGLIEALRHSSADVRRRAAAALRALGASSAIPALQAALVKEQDSEVRGAIIVTLDSLFEQEVDEDSEAPDDQYSTVVRLIAQLSSRQPERVIRAAQRLGELKEKIAAESLILVFHNCELPSRVRLAAAEALLKLESAPVEVALLGALRHTDARVRRNAAAVLGQLDADWAVQPLRQALNDENELVQRTAQAALKRIGTPEALIALAAASIPDTPLEPTETKAAPAAAPLAETPPAAAPVLPAEMPPGQTPPPAAAPLAETPPAAVPVQPPVVSAQPTPAAVEVLPPVETQPPAAMPASETPTEPVEAVAAASTPPAQNAAPTDEEDTQPTLPVS